MNKNLNNITGPVDLSELELKTFTEQDAEDYCQINNINPDDIKMLILNENKLTNISGIKIFENLIQLNLEYNQITDISILKYLKNLKNLYLGNNYIKDISVIKNLNNLEYLNITDLELESNQIKYINLCKKLKHLWCLNGFENSSVIDQINKSINIYSQFY